LWGSVPFLPLIRPHESILREMKGIGQWSDGNGKRVEKKASAYLAGSGIDAELGYTRV